jgi:DNA polymerase-3 subunit alpha
VGTAFRKEKDVDSDFLVAFRDTVKQHFEQKYGINYVCSLGNYGRLKLRSAMKDFCRAEGLQFKYVNYVTKEIDEKLEYTWKDIFTYAQKSEVLYGFVQKYPHIINYLKDTLNNPKSTGIHASGVVVVPKHDSDGNAMEMQDWMPVKFDEKKQMIISEWEGKYVDRAGFLKQDLLGLKQLDKFTNILQLIEKNTGEKLDLNTISTDDEKVFKLFAKGHTTDVFQFSGYGIRNFCKEVMPDSLEDLIAMNALYRPSAMASNSHKKYAMIKHGKMKAHFDYGLKSVTGKTHGLLIYQEQIMKSCEVLAGYSPVEADGIRTIIKKFLRSELEKQQSKFVNGALKNGCSPEEAETIWQKILSSSGYTFNRSHSASYAVTAYWSMYLKAHYPLEFWTSALNWNHEEKIPFILREMKLVNRNIKVYPPDINNSNLVFTDKIDENSIYWSLSKIKGLGEATVSKILDDRNAKGKYFTMEEFLARIPKKSVNKKTVKTLILAGAFDKLEGIEQLNHRSRILRRFYQLRKEGDEDECEILNNPLVHKNYFWVLMQKGLIGQGYIDYEEIMFDNKVDTKITKMYMDSHDFMKVKFQTTYKSTELVTVAGVLIHCKVRDSKKGPFCVLEIESNTESIEVIFWNDLWLKNKDLIETMQGRMIAVCGRPGFDDWRKKNTVYSNEKTKIIEL